MIIGMSLFLIILVLYPLYINHVDTSIEISVLEKTKTEKQKKIDEIIAIQRLFTASGSSEIKSKVLKYNHAFDTSNIMEVVMLNKFTKDSLLSPAQVKIGAIAIDKGKKLPSGLSLANVSVMVSADTPDQIVSYITYLTTESPYAFTIDSITLPLDTATLPQDNKGLSLSLSLGVYYYE